MDEMMEDLGKHFIHARNDGCFCGVISAMHGMMDVLERHFVLKTAVTLMELLTGKHSVNLDVLLELDLFENLSLMAASQRRIMHETKFLCIIRVRNPGQNVPYCCIR
jgi:hypothetical protein